ncbi:MAG: hypothetical protein JSV34_04820, partial [Candidatus Omnitrophota bacterium]
MKVEFAFLVSIFFSIGIIIALFIEYIRGQRTINIRKKSNLCKQDCEVCTTVCFVLPSLNYWQCYFCGSINKRDDYRNRNSSG